jgi:hypothetical protein
MHALAHINETPAAMVVAGGGSDFWHKAESYCNVININFPVAAQARP